MKMKTYTVREVVVTIQPYVVEEDGVIVAEFSTELKADQFARLLNQTQDQARIILNMSVAKPDTRKGR